MSDTRILVAYYSRTGNTRLVAEEIARALGEADIEEIKDTVDRTGWLGYLRSGRDAWKERLTVLASPGRDVRPYEMVVIGTPVWRSSLSVPVRTYLAAHVGQFRHVGFFLTYGGVGRERTFSQMARVIDLLPEAVIAVRQNQIARRDYLSDVNRFAKRLLAQASRVTAHHV